MKAPKFDLDYPHRQSQSCDRYRLGSKCHISHAFLSHMGKVSRIQFESSKMRSEVRELLEQPDNIFFGGYYYILVYESLLLCDLYVLHCKIV